MSEDNISQKPLLSVSKNTILLQRLQNVEKLQQIDRLETLSKIKKSDNTLEIKKFMLSLQQRTFDTPDQSKSDLRQHAQQSIEKLKRDSKLTSSPDSRQTTAVEKQIEVKEIEVKPFQV